MKPLQKPLSQNKSAGHNVPLSHVPTQKVGFLENVRKRFGKTALKVILGTALAGGGIAGVKTLAERNIASHKVPLAKERATISQIYKLNERNPTDRAVLDLIDSMAKKHRISRERVLETFEARRDLEVEARRLTARANSEKNLSEKQRLERMVDIVATATNSPKVAQRIEQVMSQRGTLEQTRKYLTK